MVETGARFVLDPRRKHFPTLVSDGRQRRVDLLCTAVDVAVELGAPVVSMWSGAAPADEPPRARLGPAGRRLRARARARRSATAITLAFEPEPGMLVETLADYERLRERLGHPQALGLTLDIGHIVCLEPMSVTECVRRGAATLAHVHIEDMRRGVHEHLMFGEGELDLDEALARAHRGRLRRAWSPSSSRAIRTPRTRRCRRAMAALRASEREVVAHEPRELLRGARGAGAPEGLAWLREASAAVAADATAVRTRFPMVGPQGRARAARGGRRPGRRPRLDDRRRRAHAAAGRDGRARPRASSPSSTATATPPSAAACCARCRTWTSATAAWASPTTRSAPTTRG